MRAILFLLALSAAGFAQGADWNGYGDTATVRGFKGDTLLYTKAFQYYDVARVSVFANDTSEAGFADDSISFAWGYQTGHWAFTTPRSSAPVWLWSTAVAVDTFTVATADTLSVNGWAIKSAIIKPEWDAYYRFWFQGLDGNKTGSFVRLVAQVARRK